MIEDLLKAAALGAVQGLTEFLPISSTGHLILAARVLRVDEDEYGLAFDAALHLGTLAALLAFFWREWFVLAGGFVTTLRTRSLQDEQGRLAWFIVVGTIPAAVLGVLFADEIESAFRNPALVATMLIAFSAVFVVAERLATQRRDIAEMRWTDAAFLGFAQAVALVPGVSRSGSTISAGLLAGMNRQQAARFAFLLSAPIIAGAGLSQTAGVLPDFRRGDLGGSDAAFFATGTVTAGIVGYASIAFLIRFLASNTLIPFVVYRVALGLLVFGVIAALALT
jgi:undecaprenyl-diphosphatase